MQQEAEFGQAGAPVTPKKVEQGGVLEHAVRSDISYISGQIYEHLCAITKF